MSLRDSFGLSILGASLCIYLAFRIHGRLGELISMTLTLALFALPLAGAWASGHSQSILFNGLIPLSDASNYYIDSLRILERLDISHFSAMRPIFPGFLSLLMAMTSHNLMLSSAILTCIAALSVFFVARELELTHGTEVACFLLILLFLYYRHHEGTTLSETLGVSVGVLGTGLIWRGLARKSLLPSLFGLFVLGLALNIRPGTMFVLPLILLWVAWTFKANNEWISPKIMAMGSAAIIFSFVINFFLIRLLGDPSGTAFANFSWALYGLAAGGKSFNYVFQVHPEVRTLIDPEQTKTIYRMAFELMQQQPNLFVAGLLQRWSYFFSGTWYNAYSFVAGDNFLINTIMRWALYILCILGFVKWFQNPRDDLAAFSSLMAIGIVISVPFVPPTDAYRVRLYAATIIGFGLLPCIGIGFILEKLKLLNLSDSWKDTQTNFEIVPFSILLVGLILIAPVISRLKPLALPNSRFICTTNTSRAMIRFDSGSSFNILRDNNVFLDWMPNFHRRTVLKNSHDLADIYIIQYLEKLNLPVTLYYSLDYLSNIGILTILPTNELPKPGSLVGLCGNFVDDPNLSTYNVFETSEIVYLDQ